MCFTDIGNVGGTGFIKIRLLVLFEFEMFSETSTYDCPLDNWL